MTMAKKDGATIRAGQWAINYSSCRVVNRQINKEGVFKNRLLKIMEVEKQRREKIS
jgi:hypothetical protein